MGLILDILMGCLATAAVVLVVTQVIYPALGDRPLFPAFRTREQAMDEESEARDDLEMWKYRRTERRTMERAGEIEKDLTKKNRRKP